MHGSLCPDAGGSATERVGVPEGPEVHHSWFPNGIECGGSARAIGGYARRAMTTVALGAYPRIGLRLLAMACVVGGAGSLVPEAAAVADFRTPGRSAYCGRSHAEPPYSLTCWRPKDGFTVSMRERGRAGKFYNPLNRGYHDIVPREVAFGGHWHPRRFCFWCTSRRTGLICWNRAGHGWWLGRDRGYRLF
jgi:hypothetical protein